MNPSTIISIITSLEKIGRAEQEQKFREGIIEALGSIVNQINSINHIQMQELSTILTRMEWIQYGIASILLLCLMVIGFIILKMNKRIKILESKINQI